MHFHDDPGESLLHLLAFRPSMNLRCATLLELPAQDCNKMKQAATSARRLGYIPDLSVTCTKDTGATSSKKRSKRVQNVHTCNKRMSKSELLSSRQVATLYSGFGFIRPSFAAWTTGAPWGKFCEEISAKPVRRT